jgi:hypothetical protein
VLVQARALGRIDERAASRLGTRLARTHNHWDLLALDESILERVEREFPVEPIRTLDAIHLASALAARSALPDLALLSLDRRIRRSAERLGFEVLPRS